MGGTSNPPELGGAFLPAPQRRELIINLKTILS